MGPFRVYGALYSVLEILGCMRPFGFIGPLGCMGPFKAYGALYNVLDFLRCMGHLKQ